MSITVNGLDVGFRQYPNGETLVTSEDIYAKGVINFVTFTYESDADLVRLMFIKRHLDKSGERVALTIRYMPYSRMDRAEHGSVFTLRYVAEFINALGFHSVTVEEPHSDVTCALLDRSSAVYPTIDLLPEVMEQIGFDKDRDYLVFPDAGAQKRYAGVTGYNTAVGFKHRDFATGQLSGEMSLLGDEGVRPGDLPKALVVDDLCSRGGTFVMASKALRARGFAEVYLFVAHCELNMWTGELLDHIDGLYCTDSMITDTHDDPKVHIHTREDGWI